MQIFSKIKQEFALAKKSANREFSLTATAAGLSGICIAWGVASYICGDKEMAYGAMVPGTLSLIALAGGVYKTHQQVKRYRQANQSFG